MWFCAVPVKPAMEILIDSLLKAADHLQHFVGLNIYLCAFRSKVEGTFDDCILIGHIMQISKLIA